MLTGDAIIKAVECGDIEITDFDIKKINPNSYNLSIGNKIGTYLLKDNVLNIGDKPEIVIYDIADNLSKEQTILMPGTLYLIPTSERIHTDKYIPCITGRSSAGRLGINIHQVAGFGDIGFDGVWTLQVTVVYPTIIKPNISIAQIYFNKPDGDVCHLYSGKYQYSYDIAPSKIYTEL